MVLRALPFGLAIGIAVGMLGGGGSVLAVPVLVYVLGQSVSEATTASLVIVTAGARSPAAWATHERDGSAGAAPAHPPSPPSPGSIKLTTHLDADRRADRSAAITHRHDGPCGLRDAALLRIHGNRGRNTSGRTRTRAMSCTGRGPAARDRRSFRSVRTRGSSRLHRVPCG